MLISALCCLFSFASVNASHAAPLTADIPAWTVSFFQDLADSQTTIQIERGDLVLAKNATLHQRRLASAVTAQQNLIQSFTSVDLAKLEESPEFRTSAEALRLSLEDLSTALTTVSIVSKNSADADQA